MTRIYILKVFKKDGSRYENHHCDGTYHFINVLQRAVGIALADDDNDVVELRISTQQT